MYKRQELAHAINPSKRINDCKKQLAFADTFQNRINLGDALYEIGDFSFGIEEYEIALNGNYTQDVGVVKKLIRGYFETHQYEKVIFCAEKIQRRPDFIGSKSQFLYGLALEEVGRSTEAEENLKPIDQRYSNYEERYLLAEFLIKKTKNEEAKELLLEIISESQHMSKPNRNRYRTVVNDVRKLLASLS